jgi:hypothetical protein
MLTFTSKSPSPVDFDPASLLQAANLLLGTTKARLLFQDQSAKGILTIISHLETAAKAFKANPQAPLPQDALIPPSVPDLAALRSQYVADILNLKFLQESPSTTNQLSFRLRGPNQLRAFLHNEIILPTEPSTNEVQVRVSLKDLQKIITDAEETGRTTIRLSLTPKRVRELQQAIQGMATFNLTFQDELPERPEVRRAQIGNISKRCEHLALLKTTTPQQEANPFIENFSGTNATLYRNCQPTTINIIDQKDEMQTIELRLDFPRIIPLILRQQQNREREIEQGVDEIHSTAKLNPGKGLLTDRELSQHTARTYGCNGRDFVAASKTITESLVQNLHQAIRTWHQHTPETPITPDMEYDFCREYALLSMSLRQRPVPLHKLEPASKPTPLRDLSDINPTAPDHIENPYIQPIIDQTNDFSPNRTVLISAGNEWIQNLVTNRIEKQYHSEAAITYADHLENIFGISNASAKIALIESNIYQHPVQAANLGLDAAYLPNTIPPLDGPTRILEFNTVYMTERMNEEFEQEKQRADDERSQQKLDEEQTEEQQINKVDQLHKLDPTALKLINRPIILHRLRSYSWRTQGLKLHKPDPENPDIDKELPPLSPLTVPHKEDGTPLEIQDLLTPEAYQDTIAKTRDNSKLSAALNSLSESLKQWQLDFRKIDKENRSTWQRQLLSNSKNPLERHLHRWLSDVAHNVPKSRCASYEELTQLFTPTLRNCAPIPQNLDKTQEYFRTPTWSSPLPLLLLCGTGHEQLKTLHKDAPSLVDMAARWTNANAVSEPLLQHSEELLQELEQILQNQTFEDFLTAATQHAIKVELSQPPDYTRDYVESNSLPVYPSLIDPALKPLTEIYLPLRKSPRTMLLKGEETPIDAVLQHLENQGIKIELTQAELDAIKDAPRAALDEWKTQSLKAQSLFKNLDHPTNKQASIDIIINSSTTEEPDPLDIAIEDLHEKLPESENSLAKIAEELLTHNPTSFRVNLLDTSFTATKDNNGHWKANITDAAALEAVAKIQYASDTLEIYKAYQTAKDTLETLDPNSDSFQRLSHSARNTIKTWEQEVPERTKNTLILASINAHRARLLFHISEIPKAIESLPEGILDQDKVQAQTQPLLLRCTQIHDAKRALALCQIIISDWEDNELDERAVFSLDNEVINPKGLVDYVIQKITGHANQTGTAALPKYFTGTLFTAADKETAAFQLATSGKPAAALFIKETLAQNIAKLTAETALELPGLLAKLQTAVQKTLTTVSPEVENAFLTHPGIKTILEDRHRYPLLEQKIKHTAHELSLTKGTTREGHSVTHEQIGRDILPGKGVHQPIQFSLDDKGKSLRTNKLWTASWLQTETAQRRMQDRINLATWVRESGLPPAHAIAYLTFCRHGALPNIPEAIQSGNLRSRDEAAIISVAQRFSESLEAMGIPQDASLRTALHGAYALNEYTKGPRPNLNLWNPDWEKDILNIQPHQQPLQNQRLVSFVDQPIQNSVRIPSPFKEQHLIANAESVEQNNIENFTPAAKLQAAIAGINIEYEDHLTKYSPPQSIGMI